MTGHLKVCQRGHFLTLDNTQSIGGGRVRCKICRRRISREHFRRKTGYYDRHPLAANPESSS